MLVDERQVVKDRSHAVESIPDLVAQASAAQVGRLVAQVVELQRHLGIDSCSREHV